MNNLLTSNKYYPHKKLNGLTLIELMITVAIVGILASIALPSYNSYVTRAKLAEAMVFLERAKLAVNIYHQDGGDLATLDNTVGNTFIPLGLKKSINTDLLNDYWIKGWGGNDITIWVRTKPTSPLQTNLQNKWIFYLAGNVSGRQIEWECLSDFYDGVKQFVPIDCR